MKSIITVYFWFWIVVGIIITMITNTVLFLFNSPKHYQRKCIEIFMAQFPTYMMELAGFWEIKYIDLTKNKTNPNTNYVIVSNHTSLIDTIFTAQLPYTKVFTWNKKWAYTPGFGWLCYLAGHIAIDKNSTISKQNAIIESINNLNNNTSIIFYPEGTRNKNPDKNQLLPFKTGAFRVAQQANKEILPITLIGTHKACNGFICDYAKIEIIIDMPMTIENIDTTIDNVRYIMKFNMNKVNMNKVNLI